MNNHEFWDYFVIFTTIVGLGIITIASVVTLLS